MIESIRVKNYLRELLGQKGIETFILEIEEAVKVESNIYNEIIAQKSRLNSLDKNFLKGVISNEYYQIEKNKITRYFISLVNEIEIRDLKQKNLAKTFEAKNEAIYFANKNISRSTNFLLIVVALIFSILSIVSNKIGLEALLNKAENVSQEFIFWMISITIGLLIFTVQVYAGKLIKEGKILYLISVMLFISSMSVLFNFTGLYDTYANGSNELMLNASHSNNPIEAISDLVNGDVVGNEKNLILLCLFLSLLLDFPIFIVTLILGINMNYRTIEKKTVANRVG